MNCIWLTESTLSTERFANAGHRAAKVGNEDVQVSFAALALAEKWVSAVCASGFVTRTASERGALL